MTVPQPMLTQDVLLDRWAHIVETRPDKTWTSWDAPLRFWCQWLRKLLDSKQPRRLPRHLRPFVESELKWAIADYTYLKTLTYAIPDDTLGPPSRAKREAMAQPHPFIHLLVARRWNTNSDESDGSGAVRSRAARKPRKGGSGDSSQPAVPPRKQQKHPRRLPRKGEQ